MGTARRLSPDWPGLAQPIANHQNATLTSHALSAHRIASPPNDPESRVAGAAHEPRLLTIRWP